MFALRIATAGALGIATLVALRLATDGALGSATLGALRIATFALGLATVGGVVR